MKLSETYGTVKIHEPMLWQKWKSERCNKFWFFVFGKCCPGTNYVVTKKIAASRAKTWTLRLLFVKVLPKNKLQCHKKTQMACYDLNIETVENRTSRKIWGPLRAIWTKLGKSNGTGKTINSFYQKNKKKNMKWNTMTLRFGTNVAREQTALVTKQNTKWDATTTKFWQTTREKMQNNKAAAQKFDERQ